MRTKSANHEGRRSGGEVPVPPAAQQAIEALADTAGIVGLSVLDTTCNVESVQARLADEVRLFRSLRGVAEELLGSNATLNEDAEASAASAGRVAEEVRRSEGDMRQALADVASIVRWVESTAQKLERLQADMAGVGEIARHIDAIAQQTIVLALNARIEASRSGAAGAGFAVIANSVRTLADQTVHAARTIASTLEPLVAVVGDLSSTTEEARSGAASAEQSTMAVARALEHSDAEVGALDGHLASMTALAGSTRQGLDTFVGSLGSLVDGVTETDADLAHAAANLQDLMGHSEVLIQLSVQTGVATRDAPYLLETVERAEQVGALFERAVQEGEITIDDLFDEQYREVPGTDPRQVVTRFVELTDRLLPPVQEEMLHFSPLVVFAVCVDRNGYLPTHNRKFSEPQGPDPVWNAAHSRNRRIFDDRTGINAARNREPYLLQTYRRDMGGGTFALMKDLSAPIFVRGRHWGGLRFAYATEQMGAGSVRMPPAGVKDEVLAHLRSTRRR